jgi:hypothetical protein
MSKKIIVEFSGWVECDSSRVFFQYIGDEHDDGVTRWPLITGNEWLKLSQDEQDDYILKDYIEAQKTALDGSLDGLDVIIRNDDDTEVTAYSTYS